MNTSINTFCLSSQDKLTSIFQGVNTLNEPRRIQRIRESAGLSRLEFGEKLGLTDDQVGKLERGDREASREVLAKIVEHFPRVTIDYIVTGRINRDNRENGGSSFLDFEGRIETPLAKKMFRSMNQLAKGIQCFDEIATNYNNLQALEGTASALSIRPETAQALQDIRNNNLEQPVV